MNYYLLALFLAPPLRGFNLTLDDRATAPKIDSLAFSLVYLP